MGKCNEKQAALILLDAEKAFDCLNWIFMFKVLEEMTFGENFIKWVKSSYTSQSVKIIVCFF